MTNFHPIATMREFVEQIGRAVNASAEYSRATDPKARRTAKRHGQTNLYIPL
jgi:hypothetical protein